MRRHCYPAYETCRIFAFFALFALFASASTRLATSAQVISSARKKAAEKDFEIVEGIFHDGLGTFAELTLANRLIAIARIKQPPFDPSRSEAKMRDAINRLPDAHPSRAVFERERANVEAAVERGAIALIERAKPASPARVRHTAREFAGAKAADLRLEFDDGSVQPISVKTEKSNKVAVAEGQTPDIGAKWAGRYFRVSDSELETMTRELGFATVAELKSNYLNVAGLVARILIRKLGLVDCGPADFSRARVTDLDAAKFLFRQLLKFKHGNDSSAVIIFDRTSGEVNWESRLEAVDIERLTAGRISFRPSRPRAGQPVASEFGIKIDGRVVVTFQIKHRRGAARGTAR
ncbi:MAG: hypothetical protein ACREAB_01470, partial [Blastocatellia bacterium]